MMNDFLTDDDEDDSYSRDSMMNGGHEKCK